MDNNTLASNIIESVAWPLTVVVILVLFRKELSALFGRIRKGQFGDATVEFEAAVAAVEGMVQEKRGARRAVYVPGRVEERGLAEADPRSMVIKAWLEVESQARSALHRKGLLDGDATIDSGLKGLSMISDNLDDQDLAIFRELQAMRLKSARSHVFRPSSESMLAYTRLAKDLSEKFEAID